LLLTSSGESSARPRYSSGHANILSAAALDGLPASGDYTADGDHAGFRDKESPGRMAVFTAATSSHSVRIVPSVAESAAGEPPLQSAVVEERIPDWDGVLRDTGILLGTQVVAAGLIYTMPESVSSWSSEQKKRSFDKYAGNFVDPVIDKDKFYINYVLHPYWGATYYIRGRERGLDKATSFLYSALMSAMYEFGVECFFEKPSIQDLIVTPVAGSLLGALLFEPLRESIKRKPELRWYDHAALVLTDPVGVLSLGFEKLFGIESTIMVDYSSPHVQKRSAGSSFELHYNRIGVVMKFSME
jgi:hypothetical protein